VLRKRSSLASRGDSDSVQLKFHALAGELQQYRLTLDAKVRSEFDIAWGLDAEGCFRTNQDRRTFKNRLLDMVGGSVTANVADIVLKDVCVAEAEITRELRIFRFFLKPDRKAQRRRLLFLFQCDLLPGIMGRILQAKDSRD
jgi:hypothetical protein